MARNLATDMAPPFVLVAHYFIAGALFYAFSAFLLPFFANEIDGYFLTSSIAALMHLYLLGFVMMVIFGAMYQLVPVVLEIPIFSKDFAYVQFYMFTAGIIIFTYGLWDQNYIDILPYGAIMMYLSMLIFVVNIFITYKNIEKWDIVVKFVLASNIFLFIGVSIGFVIALNMFYGFYPDMLSLVKLHVASTIFGYVIMTIMGVGMILIPMFSLSHGFSDKPIKVAFYSGVFGLSIFLVSSFLIDSLFEYIGASLMLLSILCSVYQMYIIFSSRVRKQNDFWAKNMMASLLSIVVSLVFLVLSFVLNDDSYFLLFGFTLFFGFFTFFIVGHIYKILPFLVWYQRYSPLVGKIKVPMLNDMVKENIADIQFWLTFVGLILSLVAMIGKISILFVVGTIIMGFGTILVMYNIYFTLAYKKNIKEIEK